MCYLCEGRWRFHGTRYDYMAYMKLDPRERPLNFTTPSRLTELYIWISNRINKKLWDVINPRPNFNDGLNRAWMNN